MSWVDNLPAETRKVYLYMEARKEMQQTVANGVIFHVDDVTEDDGTTYTGVTGEFGGKYAAVRLDHVEWKERLEVAIDIAKKHIIRAIAYSLVPKP